MEEKEILKRHFNAFCEAWGIHTDTLSPSEYISVIQSYYLNGILTALQIASQPIQVDPRLINPQR